MPKQDVSNRLVIYICIAVLILFLLLTVVIAWAAFLITTIHSTATPNEKTYCSHLGPIPECSDISNDDYLVGLFHLHKTGNQLSFNYNYVLRDKTLHYPEIDKIQVRGPSAEHFNPNNIKIHLPETNAHTIPFEFSNNGILKTKNNVFNTFFSKLNDIRNQPIYYQVIIYTKNCPNGAFYGRLDKQCG